MSSSPRGSSGSVAKRVLVGRAFSSANLEHTLLPKVLALPVFASDALSSVAYASGEILIALTVATTSPTKYVMPISFAIAALMAIGKRFAPTPGAAAPTSSARRTSACSPGSSPPRRSSSTT